LEQNGRLRHKFARPIDARKGAVRKRSQLATKTMGKKTWTKRDRSSGEFIAQKKAPAKRKYKGVRREG
jgi:hypothetical protein